MEPISIALALAEAAGLTDKIGSLIAGDKGEAVAGRVVDVAKLVTGQPDGMQALDQVKADNDQKVRLEEALIDRENELAQLAQQDRADARDMQVAVMESDHAGWLARNFIYLLATLLVLFAIGYSVAVTFIPLTPQGERYADLILNVVIVGGLLGGVMKFFYGGGARGQPQQLGGKQLRDLSDYGR